MSLNLNSRPFDETKFKKETDWNGDPYIPVVIAADISWVGGGGDDYIVSLLMELERIGHSSLTFTAGLGEREEYRRYKAFLNTFWRERQFPKFVFVL